MVRPRYARRMRGMWVVLTFCVAVPLTGLRAEDLVGKPVLIDGDLIVIAGKPIHLWGIDAPEMDTREGYLAKRYLRTILEDHTVRCVDQGLGSVGRSWRNAISALSISARSWCSPVMPENGNSTRRATTAARP